LAEVENTEEKRLTCMKFCGPCPSRPGVPGEILFCGLGKSSKEVVEKGCNCATGCAVYTRQGLTGGYFCKKGEAG
jgi:hypothetical protein